MFPTLRYELDHLVEQDERVMVAYRLIATHDGHDVEIPGVMSMVVRDGRITSRTDYWDALTFLRQVGQA